MARFATSDDRAVGKIQGGEEGRGPVPLVIMRHRPRSATFQRETRLCPVERLDLRLLIGAQDQGVLGRIQIQPHDVEQLLFEPRVFAQLEGVNQVRLQTVSFPDPLDQGLIGLQLLGQGTGCPVGGLARLSCRVLRRISATRSLRSFGGRPPRGASCSIPGMPDSANRRRHRPTVGRVVPRRSAISWFSTPSAARRTTRAWTRCQGLRRDRAEARPQPRGRSHTNTAPSVPTLSRSSTGIGSKRKAASSRCEGWGSTAPGARRRAAGGRRGSLPRTGPRAGPPSPRGTSAALPGGGRGGSPGSGRRGSAVGRRSSFRPAPGEPARRAGSFPGRSGGRGPRRPPGGRRSAPLPPAPPAALPESPRPRRRSASRRSGSPCRPGRSPGPSGRRRPSGGARRSRFRSPSPARSPLRRGRRRSGRGSPGSGGPGPGRWARMARPGAGGRRGGGGGRYGHGGGCRP